MTDGAVGIGAMLLHALPHAQPPRRGIVLKRGNVRWRRRRWRAQELLEHPFSPNGRRRPVGIGGHRHDAGLSKQAPALLVGDRDAAELTAVDAANSVMRRETLIKKSVVRVQQVRSEERRVGKECRSRWE